MIDKIYSILKKRRYNRCEPSLENELKNRIQYFVELSEPIRLVGFWGVWLKEKANWADGTSCEFLFNLNEEVKKIYIHGLEFLFIFATKHGLHNGIPQSIIFSYTEDMKKLFDKYGLKYVYLDPLWDKYNISFDKIDRAFIEKSPSWWLSIENTDKIEENASKRNIRLDVKTAAQKYYIMRCLEKEMFEKEFKDYIFHVFSDPDLKNILPNMPTLFFYGREGWSDAPWFIN